VPAPYAREDVVSTLALGTHAVRIGGTAQPFNDKRSWISRALREAPTGIEPVASSSHDLEPDPLA
jgi:hypothetical protein